MAETYVQVPKSEWDRIVKVVRWAESMMGQDRRQPSRPAFTMDSFIAEITSTTQWASNVWRAKLISTDSGWVGYTDDTEADAVLVYAPNTSSSSFSVGSRVQVTPVGGTAGVDEKPIYFTDDHGAFPSTTHLVLGMRQNTIYQDFVTPSMTPINYLMVLTDPNGSGDSGLRLIDEGTNLAGMKVASIQQLAANAGVNGGYVTTGNQLLGGAGTTKTFATVAASLVTATEVRAGTYEYASSVWAQGYNVGVRFYDITLNDAVCYIDPPGNTGTNDNHHEHRFVVYGWGGFGVSPASVELVARTGNGDGDYSQIRIDGYVGLSPQAPTTTGPLPIGIGATVYGGIVITAGTTGGANGVIPIGNGSGGFAFATLTAGTGISIVNGAGTITISATGGGGTTYTFNDTNTIDFTDSSGTITADVRHQNSITSDSGGIRLVGDQTSPGNSKLYGTDGSGTKGWYDRTSAEEVQDAVGSILVDSTSIDFTYDDATPSITADAICTHSVTVGKGGIQLVNDEATPGNSEIYGTNGGGTKGWYPFSGYGALSWVTAPATNSSSGTAGQVAYETDGFGQSYFYLCTASSTWRRALLSSF